VTFKRTFDIGASAAGLLVLAPVILVVALLVRLKIGSPVLFRQDRPGRDGKRFLLMKFRTMTDEMIDGKLAPDAVRLTPLGQSLRAMSLDELPSLINVLIGDMSIVGPRPLLMRYLPLYTARHARRHLVRPGITGWAQVNGRNALAWPEKFDLDVWYVEHQSMMLDLRIIAMTVYYVLRRKDIAHAGEATMPEFLGYEGEA